MTATMKKTDTTSDISNKDQDIGSQNAHCGPMSFRAHSMRTNGYDAKRTYPVVTVIQSRSALDAYFKEHVSVYDFAGAVSSGEAPPLNAPKPYDGLFFAGHTLLLIVWEEPSGSIRLRVEDVTAEDDGLTIELERKTPQMTTADMAQWHILVELPKEDYKARNIRVRVNDISLPRNR